MDWINNEVDRVRNENAARVQGQRRQTLVGENSWAIWDAFRSQIDDAIKALNASPEMRSKLGEIQFNGSNTQILQIDNLRIPAVYITITYTGDGIRVERKRRQEVDGDIERCTENLVYDFGRDDQLALRTEPGEYIPLPRAVEYVLKPLVRKHDPLALSYPSLD